MNKILYALLLMAQFVVISHSYAEAANEQEREQEKLESRAELKMNELLVHLRGLRNEFPVYATCGAKTDECIRFLQSSDLAEKIKQEKDGKLQFWSKKNVIVLDEEFNYEPKAVTNSIHIKMSAPTAAILEYLYLKQ